MRQLSGTSRGRKGAGLVLVLVACTLAGVDVGANLLAVNELTQRFDMTATQKLWVQDVYTLVMAGLLVAMGGLGDRIGRRRLIMYGATGFAAASLLAAFAPSAGALIAARAALGVAGATLMPSALGLIRAMFPEPGQRRAAISAVVAGVAVGSAIGPLAGGILLSITGEPTSVFLIAAPGMLLLPVLGRWLLPEVREPGAPPFDLVSAALSLGTVFPVVYGLKVMAESGAGVAPAATVVLGGVLGVAFVRRQLSMTRPLIDVRLLRRPTFGAGIALNLLIMFVMMGVSPMLMEYLQAGAGLDPAAAGLAQLVAPVSMVAAVTVATLLARRGLRPGALMAGGFAVATAGCLALTQLPQGAGAVPVMAGASLLAAGVGVVTALVADTMVAAAPPEKAAAAGALSETGKEFGSALGMAALGAVGAAVYSARVDATVWPGISADVRATARETIGGAQAAAARLPGDLGEVLVGVARAASVQSINVVAAVSAAVLIAGALVAAGTRRRPPRHAASPSPQRHAAHPASVGHR